jgi:hypothetical protein
MSILLMCMTMLAVQSITMQSKPVVHLPPHRADVIPAYGGKLLELIDAPATIFLPTDPDLVDEPDGWSVDVRNLGPAPVTITDGAGFTMNIGAGQTLRIVRSGRTYVLKW